MYGKCSKIGCNCPGYEADPKYDPHKMDYRDIPCKYCQHTYRLHG